MRYPDEARREELEKKRAGKKRSCGQENSAWVSSVISQILN
jgi:hypothetical protein